MNIAHLYLISLMLFLLGTFLWKFVHIRLKQKQKQLLNPLKQWFTKEWYCPLGGVWEPFLSGGCLKVYKWLCGCYWHSVGSDQGCKEQFHIMLDFPTNHSCTLIKKIPVCNYLSLGPNSVLHKNTNIQGFNIHWIFRKC